MRPKADRESPGRHPDPGELLCPAGHGLCADLSRDPGAQPGARRPDGLRRLRVLSGPGGRRAAACRSRSSPALLGAALLGALVYCGVMRPLAGYPVAVGVLATIALGILLRSIVTLIWSGQTRYPAEYLGQLGRPIELASGHHASAGSMPRSSWPPSSRCSAFRSCCNARGRRRDARRRRECRCSRRSAGSISTRINALSWAAATLMATVAGIFFSLKVRLGPGHLVCRPRRLCAGADRRHGQPARRRDRARSSSPRPKCWPRATSRRRSRSPRRSSCCWSRCGSGRGASMARARSLSAYEAGSPVSRARCAPTIARDMQLLDSGFVRFWALAGLAAALLLPLVLTNFWTGVANQAFIAIIGALALNLLMGTTGQISLGHAGFIAAGAFTAAALVTHVEAPFAVTLLAAAHRRCACSGVLVGLPALRLKGLYLAVSTLAAHFVIIVGLGQYQAAISYGCGLHHPAAVGVRPRDRLRSAHGTIFLLPAAARRAAAQPELAALGLRARLDGDPSSRHRGGVARHQCRALQAAGVQRQYRADLLLPARCGPITPASSRSKPSTSTC